MQFVRQHTSVPVPKVYMAFEHKGRVYILMERLRGQMIGQGWVYRSKESKDAVLRSLKTMVEEWRAIPAPEKAGVANVDGGPISDPRLPKQFLWGPFSSVDEFHRELRNGIESEHLTGEQPHMPGFDRFISLHEQSWPASVFTHGDLSSSNILCRGDEITGIIDWETAGWYPNYWEYTNAWNVNPRDTFWQQEVDMFVTPWPDALEMETLRRKYFGDY
ncbi:hypothetical protein B0A50_08690 [Salinomyces thailandicus]|uniref:Aminoglycoside phosphotransferase domain-containing protein n=1 Tax=Salinomyces thailandicus TaxID=706561 RepID=A0A4U0TJM8_9PEZI|nr:hypothetical protein B0A50_08690 [Salinomyces thailandica]